MVMNRWLWKEVLRKIKRGEVVLLKKIFLESVVSELENNLEIRLFLWLSQILLEDSNFPSYTGSFTLLFNIV